MYLRQKYQERNENVTHLDFEGVLVGVVVREAQLVHGMLVHRAHWDCDGCIFHEITRGRGTVAPVDAVLHSDVPVLNEEVR